MTPAWAAALVLGGVLAALVWFATVGGARRGMVDVDRSPAGDATRPARRDGLPCDVPLSYEEAGEIVTLLWQLRQPAAAAGLPTSAQRALLYARLLEARLAAPRAVPDA